MVITATERTQIMYLVVGMFNAAPGATYLAEISGYAQQGVSIGGDIAEGLANSTQFKAIYPDYQTSIEFATAFANNLLGSTVTDAAKTEAITAIQASLDAGQSKASVMVTTILNLFTVGVSDPKWGNALVALNNKVDVAEWFSIEKAVTTEKVSDLQAILSTVTEDPATATAAKDDKNLPGVTATFTANLDALEGSSGSDQFSGVIDATGSIQVGDSLDAGGSYDTLRIVAISGGLDTTLTSVTNVEEVVITESSATDKTHNLSTITGLQKLSLNSPGATGQTTTVSGVATSVDFTMTGQAGGNVVINYSDAAETGDQTAKLLTKGSVGGNITAAGVEIVELTTEGTATSAIGDLTFADAKSISITGTTNVTGTISTTVADATLTLDGSAKIVLGTLDADIDTVTATANTGGVELTLDTDKNTQVSLGTGDDKVTTATTYAAIATDTALIAAGEGNDTLTITSTDHLATAGHFTGFESLILEDNVSIDMDNIAGVTALEIKAATASAGATNLTAAVASNVTLRAATGTVVLEIKGATTLNQVDTVTITVDDALEPISDVVVAASLQTAGVEIINIVANDGADFRLSEANNSKLNSITLSGAGDVDLVTGDLASTTVAITGATVTGALSIDASAFAGTTSTITGSVGADTLIGGASIDTITGGEGADTITGGAGRDIIVLTESTAAIDTVIFTGSTGHVVTGYGTTDKITIQDAGIALANGATDGAVVAVSQADAAVTGTANDTVINLTQAVSAAAATAIDTYQGTSSAANLTALIAAIAGSTGAGEAFDGGLETNLRDAADITVFTVHSATDTVAFTYTAGAGAGTADATLEVEEIAIIGVFDSATAVTQADFTIV